jgi:hypothetical protein
LNIYRRGQRLRQNASSLSRGYARA